MVRAEVADDGATARQAAFLKHERYPGERVPGAKLVPFSVEAGGRWDAEAWNFLRRAAGRASERHPGLAALGGQGAAAVYQSWLRQLSCTLQKANVSWLRAAGAGGRGPAAGARADGALPEGLDDLRAGAGADGDDGAGVGDAEDWLADAVEGLLRECAAKAGMNL